MEAYFNELSLHGITEFSYEQKSHLRDTYKAIHSRISTCRISAEDQERLIKCAGNDRNLSGFLFSFFRQPFENDDLLSHEDDFILKDIAYKETNAVGIRAAFLTDSIVMSIYGREWDCSELEITVDKKDTIVRNASTAEHVQEHSEWLASLTEIELCECSLFPNEKELSIREDHGISELEHHAMKLLKSPYVVGIINSLPFNRFERKYIRRVKQDGIIEIVLFWYDEGYGLAVQTTGRNYRETEQIARILEEKYGRK